jgi:hypothetical protein
LSSLATSVLKLKPSWTVVLTACLACATLSALSAMVACLVVPSVTPMVLK